MQRVDAMNAEGDGEAAACETQRQTSVDLTMSVFMGWPAVV
jgi:hypothetical protein